MEPHEYFNDIKTNIKQANLDDFNKQIEVIKEQITLAKAAGQDQFVHRLSFTYKTIIAEIQLIASGITRYVYRDSLVKFIETVKPKDSVKIIELSRYPRVIPPENLKKIVEAKELDIFDDFFVIYTDFSNDKQQTKQDSELIQRNKDPIVFGWFKHDKTGYKHDRCYFITDWVDEYCDLTFIKLVEKLQEVGEPAFTLERHNLNFEKDIDKIVKESFEEMNKDVRQDFVKSDQSWIRKLWQKWKT